ncbi:MAG TPA: RagB/SusD family nutrient uptake outer membrane protein [Longimicrobium sp.]|nr:RagB/SusD family nutrient uptake outer membrane protein [Longimicrobium sp.]
MTRAPHAGRRRAAWRAPLVALALLSQLAACGGLLDVQTSNRIEADPFEADPQNAQTLLNGVVGDFECAAGAYAALGGLIGDELQDATQTADRFPYDQRTATAADRRYQANNCDALGVYTPLNKARAGADNLLRLLGGWTDAQVPNRARMIATASAISGYALVFIGEGFCSATISGFGAGGAPVYGGEITPAAVLDSAIARFNAALAANGGDSAIARLARLGRARAELDLGRYDQARADAATIPAGFAYTLTTSGSSTLRQNKVWNESNATSQSATVGPLYRRLGDPRVPVDSVAGSGPGGIKLSVTGLQLWVQKKYASPSSPMLLAGYPEARLIIAEAAARANDLAPAQAVIAEERTRGGQPAFTGTTQAQALAEIVDQRRREFFLDGHHLGDYIRFALPLSPAAGTAYHAGGNYGTQRCLPLPDIERKNNPDI